MLPFLVPEKDQQNAVVDDRATSSCSQSVLLGPYAYNTSSLISNNGKEEGCSKGSLFNLKRVKRRSVASIGASGHKPFPTSASTRSTTTRRRYSSVFLSSAVMSLLLLMFIAMSFSFQRVSQVGYYTFEQTKTYRIALLGEGGAHFFACLRTQDPQNSHLLTLSSMMANAVVFASAASTSCAKERIIEFKGRAQAGNPSFIYSTDQSLVVGINLVVPEFSLLMKSRQSSSSSSSSSSAAGTATLDLAARGVVEAESVPAGLKLSGASVTINRGEAIFSNLVVQTAPPASATNYKIRFTAYLQVDNGSAATTSSTTTTTVSPANSSDGDDNGGQPLLAEVSIETAPIRIIEANTTTLQTLVSADFGPNGYFHHAAFPQKVPTNADIPAFDIRPLNIFGHVIPSTDVTIKATCADGDLTSSGGTAPAVFRGVGQTTISGLRLNITSTTEVVSTNFNFTVSPAGDVKSAVTLVSGSVGPEYGKNVLRNFFMLFTSSSLFSRDNIGNTAVLGVPMPVIEIGLYTSKMELDTSNTGLIITATCTQASLVGAEALVVKGVAQFKNLAFAVPESSSSSTVDLPRSVVITFTAGSQGSLLVNNAKLYSGTVAVTVSPVRARHMRLSPTFSFVQSETSGAGAAASGVRPLPLVSPMSRRVIPSSASSPTTEFTIPSIVVEMKDSAFQFDPAANDMEIEVSLEPPQTFTILLPSSGGDYYADTKSASIRLNVTNGIASVNDLKIGGGSAGTTFAVRIADPTGVRSPILSGMYILKAATPTAGVALMAEINANCRAAATPASSTCAYKIAFAEPRLSYIYAEDVRLDATVGVALPEVTLYLKDSFGNPVVQDDSTQVPLIFAYTTTSAAASGADSSSTSLDVLTSSSILVSEGSSNVGEWRRDRYVFTCLQFSSAPNGLIRVYFGAMEGATSSLYRGISTIRSGFFSVTEGPEARHSIAFSPDASLVVQYPNDPLSAVVGVALPPLVIHVLDSSGSIDSAANDVEVIASTSAGTLDTNHVRQTSQAGVVSFHLLRFLSLADSPKITFRAVLPGKSVDGLTLSTGSIVLTPRPIPHYSIAFSQPYVEFPKPSSSGSSSQLAVLRNNQPLTYASMPSVDISFFVSLRDSSHQDETETPSSASSSSTSLNQYVAFQLVSDQAKLSDDGTVYILGEGGDLFYRPGGTRPPTSASSTSTSTSATTKAVATTSNAPTSSTISSAAASTTSMVMSSTSSPLTEEEHYSSSSSTTTALQQRAFNLMIDSSNDTAVGATTVLATTAAAATASSSSTSTTTTATQRPASTTTPTPQTFVVSWMPNIFIRNIKIRELLPLGGTTGSTALPIYIKIKLIASSSPSIGFTPLTVGPITFADTKQGKGTCASRNNKPTVVMELASSAESFYAHNASFREDLAYTLGIEGDRISFSNLRLARGQDFRTVQKWNGVKVNVQIDDPSRTSTNRKASSELANELVTIDSFCSARRQQDQLRKQRQEGSQQSGGGATDSSSSYLSPLLSVQANDISPSLKAAYFLANDRSCDVNGFRAGLTAGEACNKQGEISTCECYLMHVVAPHGVPCVREPAVTDEILVMCKLLSTCRSTDIANVCEEVLSNYKKSYWWAWLVLAGAVVVCAAIVVLLWYVVIYKRSPKVTLNAEKGDD